MAEGRNIVFRRGPDFKSPGQLESSPKRDVAIDFKQLETTCGLHTISLNAKVDVIGQIVNRLKYLESNPFVNALTGEFVTVTFENKWGNQMWSLSTGERLWARNAEHQYMSLNSEYFGGGYLTIQFEGKWPLGAVDRHVIRFSDLMQYYKQYLIGHIEAVLNWPGLLSLSKPVVGRYDIAFDVRYRHPLHLLHSTRDMRFDGRISGDKRNSARHTKASTKSHSTEFTRYRNGGKKNKRPIGVRFELRRKRQSNVKSALLGGNRNGEIGDLCNYDLVKRYLEESLKKYRLIAATPILPLRLAIAREPHALVRGKLEECVNWSRTKDASKKYRELRARGIVIGSLRDDSFELLNVYEAFMAAFEAAW